VQHVSDRRQFGRPLGSLQAVQHRLAQSAVAVEGVRWLALAAAAQSVPAALALGQAQQAVRPVAYDLHQFMGAMGLTLEHPLHRWTYRARRLQSELGAAERQFQQAAHEAWCT
jgi:alkylation response protein AidB-like acyl-CoA dehydrogenase